MYAKEEVDAYTTNYDPATMSLSMDEVLALRRRRREEAALHGVDESRRRAKFAERKAVLVGRSRLPH